MKSKHLYQDKIIDNLKLIMEKEETSMAKAKDLLLDGIINKRSIFAFGASHAGILTQELFYRAGGLININPIFSEDLMVNVKPISKTSQMERLEGYGKVIYESSKIKEGDILILHSVSGRNPVIIDLALEAKKHQVSIIAITNVTYSKSVSSRHSSGKNLYEVADVVIDTHGEIGDAIVELDHSKQKVGPASTVLACFIMNSIVVELAQTIDEMPDMAVPVFFSANLDNTDNENQALVEAYKDTIHYDF